ncbi:MAG: alpha/beta hydrolase [Magnetospirillum sp.]|nr:alpha/beta hydrolase [Magnetospirillum sp.]
MARLSLLAAAAILAALAWINHRRTRRAERARPPRGRFMELAGARLHLLEAGAGPPVLLLHGNGASAEDFVAGGLFHRLARRHRVIAVDRPGFGHSPRPPGAWTAGAQADLLAQAIAGLGLGRPLVLGHSWGATVALALALDHPEAVGRLVLVSGYYYPQARADIAAFSLPALPVLGPLLCHTVWPMAAARLLPHLVKRVFAPRPVPPGFLAGSAAAMLLRPSHLRAVAEDTASLNAAVAAMAGRYSALTLPVAIVTGDDDRVVDPARHARRLHRDIPHSHLLVCPQTGHMAHYRRAR